MNDRLPEMIWSALLISALGRKAALKELRDFLRFVWEIPIENHCTIAHSPALRILKTLFEAQ
jgi:hypothetical protein